MIVGQIKNLREEVNQFQTSRKQAYNQIQNILYSGDNSDIQGNKIINPAMFSYTKIITHTNVGDSGQSVQEILLRMAQTDTWKSITFPEEQVIMKNDIIIQRMNVSKQLVADFDYRFCPIKQINTSQLETQFNVRKQQLATLYGSLGLIDFNLFQYRMTQQQITQLKADIKQIKYYPETYLQNINTYNILRMMQDCQHLLYQTEHHLENKMPTYLVDLSDQSLPKYNIYENCEFNVEIRNSNVYINHVPSQIKLFNVQVLDSQNISLMGNQNIKIQSSNNIHMKESQNQGDIYIYKGSEYYLGQNFASNGGIFQATDSPMIFLQTGDNVLQSGEFRLINCYSSQIVLESGTLQFSKTRINDCYHSKIILEKNSCRYSVVLLQKSFIYSYLNVMENAINGGKLLCKLQCFNNQCVCGINAREAIFPIGMRYYYYEQFIDSIYVIYGTNVMIKNTLGKQQQNGDVVYENGVFNEGNEMTNNRKPQYMNLFSPQILPHGSQITQKWKGYAVVNQQLQTLTEWQDI